MCAPESKTKNKQLITCALVQYLHVVNCPLHPKINAMARCHSKSARCIKITQLKIQVDRLHRAGIISRSLPSLAQVQQAQLGVFAAHCIFRSQCHCNSTQLREGQCCTTMLVHCTGTKRLGCMCITVGQSLVHGNGMLGGSGVVEHQVATTVGDEQQGGG